MNTLPVVDLLPWLISLPLIAALGSFILQGRKCCHWFCTLAAVTQALLAITLLLLIQSSSDVVEYRHAIGGWGAPLGIDLRASGLTALLVALTSCIGLVVSLYSLAYFSDPRQAARFWPLWWLLMAGLHGVFLAADAFNIYVALEIMGMASVALVALQGTVVALQAALRYLLAGLLGSLSYLLGTALLYRGYGVLDLAALAERVQPEPISWAALALISVGLLLKTALLPLHFWLPPAHSSAPAPVSAVLSALVVKASFYLLLVFWLQVMPQTAGAMGFKLLGIFGAAAILFGSVQAIRAQRLKLIVAYSTVAQLGYLFLLFPLVAPLQSGNRFNEAALHAVLYFIIAHAVAKAAMFLAAGNIQRAVGHDRLTELNAIARHMPLSLAAFTIAGASLIGLPPSGGFIGKWLLLNSAINNGQWWWAAIILGGGLLAAAYVFRVVNFAFDESGSRHSLSVSRLPRVLPVCAFALAVAAIALGFTAPWLLSFSDTSVPAFNSFVGAP